MEARVGMDIWGQHTFFFSCKDSVLALWRTVCCQYSVLVKKVQKKLQTDKY